MAIEDRLVAQQQQTKENLHFKKMQGEAEAADHSFHP